MVKQRKYYNLKKIYLINYKSISADIKLLKSFQENHTQVSQKRLIFFKFKYIPQSTRQFFKSQMQLRCNVTFTKRVPSKHLLLSRFTLTSSMNSLTLGSFSK